MAVLAALTLSPRGLLNDSHKILTGLQACLQGLFSPGLTHTLYLHVYQKHKIRTKHIVSGKVSLTQQGLSLNQSSLYVA